MLRGSFKRMERGRIAARDLLVNFQVSRRRFRFRNSRRIHRDREARCHPLVEIVACSRPQNGKLLPSKVLEAKGCKNSCNPFRGLQINNWHRAFKEQKSPHLKVKTSINFQKPFMAFPQPDKAKTKRRF